MTSTRAPSGRQQPTSGPSTAVDGFVPENVAAWLTAVTGFVAPVEFARIGNGQSNLTYSASDASGRRVVLRRPPLGELLASAHDVAREHRIMRALKATPVPTPAVVAYTEDPQISDAPLLAMSHVDGLVVEDMAAASEMTEADRGRLGRALTTALSSVHAVDLDASGLSTLASHAPYAARQLKRWRRQWERSAARDVPAVAALADRLAAAVPEQKELTLVHGDFHLLNVIASPDGSEIRAVLDWELCTLGDPIADLGGLLAYWPEPGDRSQSVFAGPALPGFPSRSEMASAYAEATGRDLSSLPFWHALGLWKIAVICEGVRSRAATHPGNAPKGGVPPRDLVADLVARAGEIADDSGF